VLLLLVLELLLLRRLQVLTDEGLWMKPLERYLRLPKSSS
jgi:hypothetical protein